MVDATTLRQAAVVVAVALVAGTISNASAGKERRLRWLADWQDTPVVTGPASGSGPGSGSGSGSGSPAATALPANTPAPSGSDAGLAPFEGHFDRVLAAHQSGALFLDARRSDDYAAGHIPGARNFAVWESDIDDKVVGLMSEVPTSTQVVVYCNGGNCEDSHLLRTKLIGAGYADVIVYKDGYPDWMAEGQPVETGAGPGGAQ